jgi:hypothetical protein
MLVETCTLVAVVAACWLATFVLSQQPHPVPEPHPMFNPAAHVNGAQVIDRTHGETR